MKWTKMGLVGLAYEGRPSWAASHAMIPTPFLTPTGALRIYFSACDGDGCGRPAMIEVEPHQPAHSIGTVKGPLLELGRPGCFDDNGVVVTAVVRGPQERVFLYYVGFERCLKIRYRLFTGLALSEDGGLSFSRHSEVPVLDRTDAETFFRCGPCVLWDGDRFRMWYVGGQRWTDVNGKQLPVYDIRYAESNDGIHWPPRGELVLAAATEDEHGFGRPWVVQDHGGWTMYLSVRKRSLGAYRLALARSKDGRTWTRCDAELGLDVEANSFDSDAIMYLATVDIDGTRYGFYNGNEFGRAGFAIARQR